MAYIIVAASFETIPYYLLAGIIDYTLWSRRERYVTAASKTKLVPPAKSAAGISIY